MGKTPTGIPRRIEAPVREDLGRKMVFVAGPRQCGKTTLAKRVAVGRHHEYFNWDVPGHRRRLRDQQLPDDKDLWIFDELHLP